MSFHRFLHEVISKASIILNGTKASLISHCSTKRKLDHVSFQSHLLFCENKNNRSTFLKSWNEVYKAVSRIWCTAFVLAFLQNLLTHNVFFFYTKILHYHSGYAIRDQTCLHSSRCKQYTVRCFISLGLNVFMFDSIFGSKSALLRCIESSIPREGLNDENRKACTELLLLLKDTACNTTFWVIHKVCMQKWHAQHRTNTKLYQFCNKRF